MKYTVYGSMKIKRAWKPFVKEMEAASESRCRETALATIGSDHRLPRTQIRIDKMEAVK